MARMLDDVKYNNIKILHELSCLAWFIDKHAKAQAKNAEDKATLDLLDALYNDLKDYLQKFDTLLCK